MLGIFKIAMKCCKRLVEDGGANFAVTTALVLPVLVVAAGGTIDASSAYLEKNRIQGALDSAVLAVAGVSDSTKRLTTAASFMPSASENPVANPLVLTSNADGSVTGTYTYEVENNFLNIVGIDNFRIVVKATAMSSGTTASSSSACIHVLGNVNQAVLINSGANVKSAACGIDVLSTSSPAFIMNSGSTISTPRFCVKGTNYIKNGGTLTNLQVGCAASADPYAGLLPEPTVPSTCAMSGAQSGTTFTLSPGVYCDVTFNGSPKLTFQSGLYIIKGTMIINSGAVVNAQGVTFYYPDVNSRILANGGLTFNASAPTSGTYAGLLMYESTSNASNNANKQQYIFNGSVGETLSGIIYLPNRNVTYNSTTNQTSTISMVVNTMIMNSSNWAVEPYTGSSPYTQSSVASVRLMN